MWRIDCLDHAIPIDESSARPVTERSNIEFWAIDISPDWQHVPHPNIIEYENWLVLQIQFSQPLKKHALKPAIFWAINKNDVRSPKKLCVLAHHTRVANVSKILYERPRLENRWPAQARVRVFIPRGGYRTSQDVSLSASILEWRAQKGPWPSRSRPQASVGKQQQALPETCNALQAIHPGSAAGCSFAARRFSLIPCAHNRPLGWPVPAILTLAWNCRHQLTLSPSIRRVGPARGLLDA